jgi:SagB-type dehydrogenase family enzyme
MSTPSDPSARARAYHERTKHHLHRYARGPAFMDWATQPDPFRTYTGAPRIDLPLSADGLTTTYDELYGGGGASRPIGVSSLGAFFECALGLTAWKEHAGNRWALRSDPSSGNLHPTEGYVVLPRTAEIAAGVYHYVSRDHALEQRCRFDAALASHAWARIPEGGFLVGVSSIHWRVAWKYGERAFRYCQHDVGHVLATVRYAAAALGWSAWLLDGFGDAAVARLLGLARDRDFARIAAADREHADAVLLVAPRGAAPPDGIAVDDLLDGATWCGEANALSAGHVTWDVIEDVSEATARPAARTVFPEVRADRPAPRPASDALAVTIIRQRRSAVSMDGRTSISAARFYAMLDVLIPRAGVPPFDALPWTPRIHLGIFVHRVDGLAPGLYLFERTDDVHAAFEDMIGPAARWTSPEDCPTHLRLYCIAEGDVRATSRTVSCHQDIAADGAFSLGMLAEFRAPIEAGAFEYRRLFWEAGVVGQVLYLAAEAAGVRATGIGCYFDDAFHEVMGLEGDRFQILYHFTVGGPVDDPRLVTHPPYAHLGR